MAEFEHDDLSPSGTTHPDAQWFPSASMGLFMHWGIHSVAGIQPSWAMIKDYPHAGTSDYPPKKYFALSEQFNPRRYDPDRWCAAAAEAGFTYAVLTTKHHDGYALWPSGHSDFGVKTSLDGRDLLQPYVDACRNNGLKVGFYFSFADWHHPAYPVGDVGYDFNKRGEFPAMGKEEDQRLFESFYDFSIGQVDELLTRYGTIDLLWFDGVGWKNRDSTALRSAETIRRIRSQQPGIVINNRWGKIGDYTTPECHFPELKPEGWWEACYTTNGHWGYNPGVALPAVSWFIEMRDKCNQWGGNFLPNIGPAPDGTMPDDFYALCTTLAERRTG